MQLPEPEMRNLPAIAEMIGNVTQLDRESLVLALLQNVRTRPTTVLCCMWLSESCGFVSLATADALSAFLYLSVSGLFFLGRTTSRGYWRCLACWRTWRRSRVSTICTRSSKPWVRSVVVCVAQHTDPGGGERKNVSSEIRTRCCIRRDVLVAMSLCGPAARARVSLCCR